MRTIKFNTKEFFIPQMWNELTSDQLLFLAVLMQQKISVQEVRTKMLLFCLDARIRRYNRASGPAYMICIDKASYPLSGEQLCVLSIELMSFLFKETDGRCELDIQLTRNPFMKIKAGKDCVLVGPDDGLTNISYGQYILLQSWQQHLDNVEGGAINQFLSVIWKRDCFATEEEGLPSLLADVDDPVKLVMLWFYIGSMNFIEGKFPRVFGGGGNGTSGESVFDMHQNIVDEMAGGDVTKKEQVKKCLLYDALYTLEMAIERAQKRERDK